MIKRLTRKDTVVLEGVLYLINNEYIATIAVLGTGEKIRIPVAVRMFTLLKIVQIFFGTYRDSYYMETP